MAADTITLHLTADDTADSIDSHIKTIEDNRYITPVVLDVEGTQHALLNAVQIIKRVESAEKATYALTAIADTIKKNKALPARLKIRLHGGIADADSAVDAATL